MGFGRVIFLPFLGVVPLVFADLGFGNDGLLEKHATIF